MDQASICILFSALFNLNAFRFVFLWNAHDKAFIIYCCLLPFRAVYKLLYFIRQLLLLIIRREWRLHYRETRATFTRTHYLAFLGFYTRTACHAMPCICNIYMCVYALDAHVSWMNLIVGWAELNLFIRLC